MPNIQKIVVSGSNISQLTNDAGYALATNITGAFTAVSTSIAADIAALELAVGGGGGLLSSSAQIATDISGAFTAVSTSIATNIATLTSAAPTYALKTDISGAFTAVSTSLSTRVTTLEVNGPTNAATASFVNSDNVKFDVTFNGTSSLQTLTSVSTSIASRATSLESRTTVLEGTGTIQGVGTTNNVTFANVTATGNVSITGTLFVDGTTTTLNSTNLNIEDKFILLNSGSGGSSAEGGIIVESSGSVGTGNAFYYDASDARWALKAGLSATNTGAVTAEAFMSVAIVDTFANATGSAYYKAGNIIVDGQDIYIVTA